MKPLTASWARLAMTLVACAGLAGCAETTLVANGSKMATEDQNNVPPYKLGKPYQIDGAWYYPKVDYDYNETGIASWYGPDFHGKSTANGEVFDQNSLTAAHKTLPMPTLVRVTNLENGRSIEVRINDRGPFVNNRIIDLTRRGAQLLGFEGQGTARVRVQVMKEDSIILASKVGAQLAYAGEPEPGGTAPKPVAAPAGQVVTQTLPGGGQAAPAAPMTSQPLSPTQPPSSSILSKPAAGTPVGPLPQPTGAVSVMPVKPTNIFIQAGAFLQQSNATKLTQKLGPLGQTRVTQVQVGAQTFYRVRLGPIQRVEDADQLLQKVIETGQPDARIIVE
ncbi:MAG TPA: septal ring lytic transglycosylase RlpA family protein [Dongiaceae bacterium]|nr:septal ring lytic transglycosylase RlpA family protein [Dongiaceae bacterium]